jgi:hypothetical protein
VREISRRTRRGGMGAASAVKPKFIAETLASLPIQV